MQGGIGQQPGNYKLIGLLGAGSFAQVYLGEHVLLNTQSAIKDFCPASGWRSLAFASP